MDRDEMKGMSTEELYKVYLAMAVFRCGGEVVVSIPEFDEMRKVICGVSCGLTKDDKFIMRCIVNPDHK
jgi:hypothetical protein